MTVSADREGRRSASGATPDVWQLLLAGGGIVLFIIAMLAASMAGHPTFTPPIPDSGPLPEPTSVLPTSNPSGTPQPQEDSIGGLVVIFILMLLLLAVVVVILVLAILALISYWKARPLRQRDGAATDVDVSGDLVEESVPDAPTMRRGIAAARAVIDAHASPGDAIVAAWVGLEETAADSGTGRGRSETPAEFTLRILLRRPGIDEPARQLLRLYERVRFGGHTASEQDRLDAISTLTRIEEGWR